jgi:hypothetical protein
MRKPATPVPAGAPAEVKTFSALHLARALVQRNRVGGLFSIRLPRKPVRRTTSDGDTLH